MKDIYHIDNTELDYNLSDQLLTNESILDNAVDSIISNLPEGLDGEVRLLIAVMKQAFTEKDISYFNGLSFLKHCKLLGLDHSVLHTSIQRKILS